jgi:hypothetical protein
MAQRGVKGIAQAHHQTSEQLGNSQAGRSNRFMPTGGLPATNLRIGCREDAANKLSAYVIQPLAVTTTNELKFRYPFISPITHCIVAPFGKGVCLLRGEPISKEAFGTPRGGGRARTPMMTQLLRDVFFFF